MSLRTVQAKTCRVFCSSNNCARKIVSEMQDRKNYQDMKSFLGEVSCIPNKGKEGGKTPYIILPIASPSSCFSPCVTDLTQLLGTIVSAVLPSFPPFSQWVGRFAFVIAVPRRCKSLPPVFSLHYAKRQNCFEWRILKLDLSRLGICDADASQKVNVSDGHILAAKS